MNNNENRFKIGYSMDEMKAMKEFNSFMADEFGILPDSQQLRKILGITRRAVSEMIVETPMGKIIVKSATDRNYPGVYVNFQSRGTEYERAVSLTEYAYDKIIHHVWGEKGDIDDSADVTSNFTIFDEDDGILARTNMSDKSKDLLLKFIESSDCYIEDAVGSEVKIRDRKGNGFSVFVSRQEEEEKKE